MEYYERLEGEVSKADRAGSSGSAGRKSIPRRPGREWIREKQRVLQFCNAVHKKSAWNLTVLSCVFSRFSLSRVSSLVEGSVFLVPTER